MPPKRKPSTRKAKPATARRAATPRPPKPQTVTPYLVVSNATEALEWYKKAFGAKVFSLIPGPNNMVMHAGFTIGGSQVLLSDPFPGMDTQPPTTIGGTSVNLHVYHKDADKLWERALANGAKVAMPYDDVFWGDKYGKVTDPFGHSWAISRKSKLPKAKLDAMRAEAMKQFGMP